MFENVDRGMDAGCIGICVPLVQVRLKMYITLGPEFLSIRMRQQLSSVIR